MTHDHDHSDGHEHSHDDPAWEVKELEEAEVVRLLEEGKLVQVEGPDGQALYIESDAFVEGVRLDLAENSENAPYLVGVGGLLLEGEHYDLAHAAVELALAADPVSADALLLAGIVEARLGQLDTALERLDAHLVQAPTSVLGQTHRAHVLLGLGRGEEGHAAARRALSLDPNDVGAIQALVAGDDGTAAALVRTKALAAEVKGWGVLRVAGDLAVSLGDDAAAIDYWKQAAAFGADDSTVANLLAQLGQAGRIDELADIADGLSRLSDRDPSLRWNVAAGYEAAGRAAEARIVFASIAHDPTAAPDLRAEAQARLNAE
jgi:tetratricopeptide (TPR) repeat protein